MALDQSALLELTEALKAGDGAQLIRTAWRRLSRHGAGVWTQLMGPSGLGRDRIHALVCGASDVTRCSCVIA